MENERIDKVQQEVVDRLMKNKSISAISEEEILKAACTHRKPMGTGDMLVENSDGSFTCRICGATFHPDKLDETEIKNTVSKMKDILQTVKLYSGIYPEQRKEYFKIIPLIDRLPDICKTARMNYANMRKQEDKEFKNHMFATMSGVFGKPNSYPILSDLDGSLKN